MFCLHSYQKSHSFFPCLLEHQWILSIRTYHLIFIIFLLNFNMAEPDNKKLIAVSLKYFDLLQDAWEAKQLNAK